MTVLVLIGIFWEIIDERISLNLVPLLLLVNFVSGIRLELISVVLYLLTRATLISPGKGETRVCGYISISIYLSIYIYIYIYLAL